MTILQSIILGTIQGVTEFLPISSSGHLVLATHLFGWNIPKEQAFTFNVLVQLGTLVAVFVYFWRDLVNIVRAILTGISGKEPFSDPHAQIGWLLVLASIPAVLAGIFFKGTVESAFGSIQKTATFLLVTAVLLVIGEYMGKQDRSLDKLSWKGALWIGCFQILALFPGVSRSGSTITGGMTYSLDRPAAARFSFLMSVPIIIAAGAFSVNKTFAIPYVIEFLPYLLVGFTTSAIVGYLAIRWLLAYLAKRPLYIFAIYTAVVGAVTLIALV